MAFDTLRPLPPDPMFTMLARFIDDTHPKKTNLAPGLYRDENGLPWPLPSIKAATERLIAQTTYNHEYLGIQGHPGFLNGASKLVFGDSVPRERLASIQTVGCTGALHIGSLFIRRADPSKTVAYVSEQSWDNHTGILEQAGYEVKTYPYWDPVSLGLDFDGFRNTVLSAEPGSVFVLHACAHNPTGCDPTIDQWTTLSQDFEAKGHVAFFDCSYQGFASGDLVLDRKAIEIFAGTRTPLIVAQSLSKIGGLYGERLGALHIVCESNEKSVPVFDHLKALQRRDVSNPPRFGADVMSLIWEDAKLYQAWLDDNKTMSNRLREMREGIVSRLKKRGTPGTWDHLLQQKGMFSYTGLTVPQCRHLTEADHIYISESGRLSLCGLLPSNLDYVADRVDWVVRNVE